LDVRYTSDPGEASTFLEEWAEDKEFGL